MKTYRFQCRQFIARPLAEVFAFFNNPANLARITPPELKFHVLNDGPVVMKNGAEITYEVRPMVFPMKWVSRIEDYSPPHRFVDVQVKGPYAHWRHTHGFREENGGTWIEDDVEYALPFGWLGQMAHPFLVAPRLQRIFDYRVRVLDGVFKSG